VVALTSVERGEIVIVIVSCNAVGQYIPPFVILKGQRMREEFVNNLPLTCHVSLSDSGYVNEELRGNDY